MLVKMIMVIVVTRVSGSFLGFHKCPEGHHCIYKRGGAVLPRMEPPGWHWHEPFLTNVSPIQTTWQTDRLTDVICGSSKGSTALLDIEVINRLSDRPECIQKVIKGHTEDYDKLLIFDYIPSEVAQFCKLYDLDQLYIGKFDDLDETLEKKLVANVESYGLADCISIKGVRIGRPKLSVEMEARFATTELLKKEQEHEQERSRTQDIKLISEAARSKAEANRLQMTATIEMETKRLDAENAAKIQCIDDVKNKKRIESDAAARSTAIRLEADANKFLLTREYLLMKHGEAIYNNAKIHTMDDTLLNKFNGLMHLNVEDV